MYFPKRTIAIYRYKEVVSGLKIWSRILLLYFCVLIGVL